MGDAGVVPEVRAADPETTADGAEPRAPTTPPPPLSTPATDYPELRPVDRGHYVIAGEIAKGGMGRVLAARDLRLGRSVAIKELLPKFRDATRRFEREARITARLQHPAIIHIYEAGVWPGGAPFYAMPNVAGRSLDKVVNERATLHERLGLLPNVIAVADALAYAHSENVIHRDLKPANILVGEFGETVVIDWGLAKDLQASPDPAMSLSLRASSDDTVTGSVVGTPAYMPPEQARGEPVDQRADVYALGALLYKLLAGVAPYQGSSSAEVLEQVKAGPPVPVRELAPGAPRDLVAIANKAMAREPVDRYVSAGELAQDLKRFQTGQLVAAQLYTRRHLIRRWLRRHRVVVTVGLVATIATASVGTFSVLRILDEREHARTEEHRASLGRTALLEERGRVDLLAGHAGAALAYLVAAAHDGGLGGARGFLIAEAMRPFEAERAQLVTGATHAVIAVSPDGHRIATGSAHGVQLWSPTGVRERALGGAAPHALAFSPDGTRLAAADGTHVRVWSGDGTPVAELAEDKPILSLAFTPDAKHLVTAGHGGARSWDLASRTNTVVDCRDDSHEDDDPPTAARMISASVSSDGTRVVTASTDGTACIWSTSTGEVLTLVRGHTGPINTVSWIAGDTNILTASDDGTARVWGAKRGKAVLAPLRHGYSSIELARLASDRRLAITAGSDGIGRLWEVPPTPEYEGKASLDGKAELALRPIATLAGHGAPILAAAFSADDAFVATAGADGLAKVWDTTTGQPIDSFEHGGAVTDVAFAGDTLVTASRDGTARIWSLHVPTRQHHLDSAVYALALASDGTVAVGTKDTRVTLVRGETTLPLSGHLNPVRALAFSPDGTQLISAGDDDRARIWDVASGSAIGELGASSAPAPITAIAITPDGATIATLSGGSVQLYARADHRVLATLQTTSEITALLFDAGGTLIAGTADGQLARWKPSGAAIGTPVRAMAGAITALAISKQGALAVASGSEVRIEERDARGRDARVTLDTPTGDTRALDFSADGALVVTAASDGVARVWDARKGKLLGMRDPHAGALTAVAVLGDTMWLGSATGAVGAWDIRGEHSGVAALEKFMRTKHAPFLLGDGDVLERR